MKLTHYQLQKYSDKFLKDNYGMTLTVPLEINGRLRRACGRFVYVRYADGSSSAKSVQLGKYFYENNKPEVVLDVLRHELVHYALFMLGKPNSDGHPVFERELSKLGVVSQKTINRYEINSKPSTFTIYECKDCGQEYKRQRALPNGGRNHSCGVSGCRGALVNKGRFLEGK